MRKSVYSLNNWHLLCISMLSIFLSTKMKSTFLRDIITQHGVAYGNMWVISI